MRVRLDFSFKPDICLNLQKGCGYHLDVLIVLIMIVICSVFGLPWFVAATVLSINHVKSMTRESECSAPGEKPQFLGIRYILLKWLNVIMFLFNPHISVPFHSELISAYKIKYDTIKFVAKLDHGKNG